MIVSGYEGSDVNVVIPHYVGSVPVIGITDEAFRSNTKIESVSLSKNTIWLDSYTFYGCTKLSAVIFNDAIITEIPEYSFYDTAITSISIPNTVTKIGDRAFYGCDLTSLNYENITYFGEYSLYGSNISYVFLKSDVEYIGAHAFNHTYMFLEHESIPSNWGDKFYGAYTPVTNARKSADYIYSINEGGIAVNRYIGTDRRIHIPSTIDNYTVTSIGCYFDSIGNYSEYEDSKLDEVVIPNTVKTIENYAFGLSQSFIYIPSSVESIDESVLQSILPFFAFETTEKPNGIEDYSRYAIGIEYSKISSDIENSIYFYEDGDGYRLLALNEYVEIDGRNIIIPAEHNGKQVHTIGAYSVYVGEDAIVTIENGVSKIQKYAIQGSIETIYIPKSVLTINAYGIDANYCFAEAKSKPDEWDTYWNGSSSSKVYFSASPELKLNDQFVYKIDGSEITLIKYVGSSDTIYIPRVIDGYTVTKIATGLYSSSYSSYIYIPKEIKVIESQAFVNTSSSYFYFYLEGTKLPLDCSEDWYYNSSYDSTTRYITKYGNQKFSY